MGSLVVLTRPEHRNAVLADKVRADGFDVVCLPALRLKPESISVEQMPWPEDFDLLVFVSSHAAQSYLDRLREHRPDGAWPARVRVATVGHASAAPLYRSGLIPDELIFHPASNDPGQDSEALWRVLQPVLEQIRRVLIVRGQAGREWLGERFDEHGIQTTRLSLYRREPETWCGNQLQTLIEAWQEGRSTVFLLTSSESVDAVYKNMDRLGLLSQWAQCQFIVIHERISDHLQTILRTVDLYVRCSIVVCAPSDDAIVQAIRSCASHPGGL